MGCPICNDEKKTRKDKKQTSTIIKLREEIPKNKIEAKKIEKDLYDENPINVEIIKDSKYDMEFIDDALKANNEFRELHDVKKLEKDQYLIDRAHILAKLLLTEGTYDNANILYKNGEELGMNSLITEKKLKGKQLMDKWYEEKNDYNFQEFNEFECFNFTQMIWKNSKKFGIGYFFIEEPGIEEKINPNKLYDDVKKESNGENNTPSNENNKHSKKFCYVALYFPPGNKPGEYSQNVNKSKKIRNDMDKGRNNEEDIDDKNKKTENGDNLEKEKKENDITILDDKILKKEDGKGIEKYSNREKNSKENHELDETYSPDK